MRGKRGTRTTSTHSSPSFTPTSEWHPSLEPAFEGKATTIKGHDAGRGGPGRNIAVRCSDGSRKSKVEEVRDLGESVLVLGRFTVTGRATRIGFDTEIPVPSSPSAKTEKVATGA